ncbi:helix-turn-helix transcriptional regulator [Sansalvadorimonas verongulae]|uniref:helix-turn-helix transcriptional regulator n=1 Tax=Sansalvadorimonas verongulae TaxID=2172824 RepID=UPI0012BCFFEA|nr:AlpA family phage regulatory protein [Sansalvadorimonas verongulae]
MAQLQNRMYDSGDLKEITKLSKTTLWRLWSRGEFPRPAFVLGRKNLWRSSEVDAWVAGTWRPAS